MEDEVLTGVFDLQLYYLHGYLIIYYRSLGRWTFRPFKATDTALAPAASFNMVNPGNDACVLHPFYQLFVVFDQTHWQVFDYSLKRLFSGKHGMEEMRGDYPSRDYYVVWTRSKEVWCQVRRADGSRMKAKCFELKFL